MEYSYNYPCYKGFYYQYNKEQDVWIIYKDYVKGGVLYFNADKFRLDEFFTYLDNMRQDVKKYDKLFPFMEEINF